MMQDRPIKVFVIEGDKAARAAIRCTFVACGHFDIEFCESHINGLRTISDFAPDVVLLDASLPREKSQLTLRALRAMPEMASVPVILAGGRGADCENEKMLALGASQVMTRPFSPFAIPQQVLKTWGQASA